MEPRLPYLTTASAGYFVAGQRVPSVQDADGNRAPKVGHRLLLTEAEAKYELLAGAIEAEPAEPAQAALSPPVKRAARATETSGNEG